MEVGLVRSIDIDKEMQQAYLDYAMSVIVARALPDARDGLKPVHRRILYAMYDMGMRPDSPYKKSARIVGEVLGKYHPHGDAAVYETMARMAQPFSLRYLMIDGQGNFGSVDGDPPAAMRYTEARLSPVAMHMLADIQKNTVDFSETFDGSLKEPEVLPAALPNLLVNGATGIAVGMSTSIPPHNLGEVVDALKFMLERWEGLDDINVEDLMRFIKGPDFPTGGVILLNTEENGLEAAYGTGRGRVMVQARVHVEEMGRGRNRIIVTELPYMTNKATLIERIAELARDQRLDGVVDLRDESDRQGMRIVIEISKAANPEKVLQELYKSTSMRSTFGIILLALVDGEPRMLSLKQALRVYLEHRLTVIRRRSEYDLERARQRAHILEGLRIALKFLDEVIAIIRKAPDADTARTKLMKRFKLSEMQATAILDMPLRRLAALERKKIEEEYKELQAQIKELVSLLKSPKKMRAAVADQLQIVRDTFSDRRRTQIVQRNGKGEKLGPFLATDHASEQSVWITVSSNGLLARSLEDIPPSLSGRDAVLSALRMNSRDTLYLIGESGETAGAPVHAVPEAVDPAAGAPVHRISALTEGDRLAALFSLPPRDERPEGGFVFTASRQGMVKKTALSELPGPTARTFTLMKINDGDRFGYVRLTDGKSDIFLATADGMAIRFLEEEVRPMGLAAAGVGGVKLQHRDEVVGMDTVVPGGEILLVASDGKGKRVSEGHFPRQGRYGQGVVAWKLPRTSQLVGAAASSEKGKQGLKFGLHLEKLAAKAVRLDDAPLQTRVASGKPLVDLKTGDRVLSVTIPYDLGGGADHTPEASSPKAKASRKASATSGSRSSSTALKNARQARLPLDDNEPSGVGKPAARASTKRATAADTAAEVKKTRQAKAGGDGATASSKKTGGAKKSAAKTKTTRAVGKAGTVKTTSTAKAAGSAKPTATAKRSGASKKAAVPSKKTSAPAKGAATAKKTASSKKTAEPKAKSSAAKNTPSKPGSSAKPKTGAAGKASTARKPAAGSKKKDKTPPKSSSGGSKKTAGGK
jgi:DNA gyrase subunit A